MIISETPHVEMLHGDCMDLMHNTPDKTYKLAIVDPPYGIGNFVPQNIPKNGRRAGELVEWNNAPPPKEYFSELIRVSKNQIIWGANYYNCFNPDGGAIIWHKGSINPIFSQCEIASVSNQKRVDYININWQSGFYRSSIENVVHPCQKPISLYRWLLQIYAKYKDNIIDTHGGSGSIVIACLEMEHDLVWIEKDADYYEAAVKRVQEYQRQGKLF